MAIDSPMELPDAELAPAHAQCLPRRLGMQTARSEQALVYMQLSVAALWHDLVAAGGHER